MISFYHQIHCLRYLQLEYVGLLANDSSTRDDTEKHADHCFDWIRQGIMCAADLAIERIDIEDDPKGDAMKMKDFGHAHTCRKWEEVGHWMRGFSQAPTAE
jgi:hypothetical protein